MTARPGQAGATRCAARHGRVRHPAGQYLGLCLGHLVAALRRLARHRAVAWTRPPSSWWRRLPNSSSIPSLLFCLAPALRCIRARCASSWAAGRPRRRLTSGGLRWLLLIGLLHGLLVWSGDVLSSYALAGMLILPLAAAGWRVSATWPGCWRAAFCCSWPCCIRSVPASRRRTPRASCRSLPAVMPSIRRAACWAWRPCALRDYGMQMLFVIVMLPHIIVLFLLGMLSVRLGWLTEPRRHRHVWQRVCAVGWAWACRSTCWPPRRCCGKQLIRIKHIANSMLLELLLYAGGPLLAAGYVAALMLAGPALMAALARWLAPVGRMALSNYLAAIAAGHVFVAGLGAGLGRCACVRSRCWAWPADHGGAACAEPLLAGVFPAGAGRGAVAPPGALNVYSAFQSKRCLSPAAAPASFWRARLAPADCRPHAMRTAPRRACSCAPGAALPRASVRDPASGARLPG